MIDIIIPVNPQSIDYILLWFLMHLGLRWWADGMSSFDNQIGIFPLPAHFFGKTIYDASKTDRDAVGTSETWREAKTLNG